MRQKPDEPVIIEFWSTRAAAHGIAHLPDVADLFNELALAIAEERLSTDQVWALLRDQTHERSPEQASPMSAIR